MVEPSSRVVCGSQPVAAINLGTVAPPSRPRSETTSACFVAGLAAGGARLAGVRCRHPLSSRAAYCAAGAGQRPCNRRSSAVARPRLLQPPRSDRRLPSRPEPTHHTAEEERCRRRSHFGNNMLSFKARDVNEITIITAANKKSYFDVKSIRWVLGERP